MSFSDYLQNRESALQNMVTSLKKEMNPETRGGDDDRIWKPKMGSDNTGYAVVRFLPGTDASKTPWVRVYDHGFQGPSGKWYIENSLTTIGQKDPVSEYNSRLWNNGTEAGKEQARKQKRRTSYYVNVLIIKDPNNPENEGKVKLYKFGQKIFDKVMAAMQPEFADEDPVNPFDLFEGANFRIKIKMVGGYWNYDASDFERPSPLSQDETKLEQVFNAQHDVHSLIADDQFKSYEELQQKLNEVLGEGPSTQERQVQRDVQSQEEKSEFDDYFKTDTTTSEGSTTSSDTSTDDDDLESYFKNLAAD
jgi:hypothetical protein